MAMISEATMTETFWINPIERHCADLLRAAMRELAGDGEISFEGGIRDTGLELLPGACFKKTDALQRRIWFLRLERHRGASSKKTGALQRQVWFPRRDFLVLPLTDDNVAAIWKVITEKDLLADRIIHVQIAVGGGLIFGAYDNFHEDCVVAYQGFPVALLDRLVANDVIRSYQTVSEDAHRWHD